MTEADFQNRFSKLTELISLLQYGRRISILDTTGNIICLADYLAETSYYIINKHLYNKAKELISYKELFLKVHNYCLTDNAAPEARQMAKECDFINCCDVLDSLEQWLNDNKENSPLNLPDNSNREKTSANDKGKRCKGRPKETLKDKMIDDKDNNKLKKIHSVIKHKKGKDAALVILACIKKGWMQKPTYKQVEEEFKNIGSQQGFTKYLNTKMFSKDEIEGTIKALEED